MISPKESLCLHAVSEDDHRCQVAAVESSLDVQQEADLAGTRALEREQRVGFSEESGPGLCPSLLSRWQASSLWGMFCGEVGRLSIDGLHWESVTWIHWPFTLPCWCWRPPQCRPHVASQSISGEGPTGGSSGGHGRLERLAGRGCGSCGHPTGLGDGAGSGLATEESRYKASPGHRFQERRPDPPCSSSAQPWGGCYCCPCSS